MQNVTTRPPAAQSRPRERGAALITVLLITMLLLAAGGTLITVTSRSASNAVDSTAETQAYYAAEAGLQGVLAVLRGNAAPSPLFDTSNPSAEVNKITFRRAITANTSYAPGSTRLLSRWLAYDATYPDRVVLNSGYAPMSGMAYTVLEVSDPDFSEVVTFSVSGAFARNDCPSSPNPCINFNSGGGGNNGFTLTYTPRASNTVNTGGGTVSETLGQLAISSANGSFDMPPNTTFELTITQTAPWSTATTKITGRLTGNVNRSGSTTISTLDLVYPQLTYSVNGVLYSVPALAQRISASAATALPVTIKAPEPMRLLVKVKGFGPRNASKHMQMLVSRFGFSYTPKGAITLRSHDDTLTPMTFVAGQSQPFVYDGTDNVGGAALPAFSVTHDPDYSLITSLASANNQMFGNPPVRKVPITELSDFLQTVGSARRTLDTLRQAARSQRWPSTCTGALSGCDRYFGPGETPSDFGGTQPNGLLTFVDGDLSLSPSTNGAGLLVVTGTLTFNGSANFNGVILVLGDGKFIRSGGGNGTSLGSVAVARLGSTQFLNPHFESSGSGNSGYRYDSEWVRKALMTAGPAVLGVSEY